MNSSSSVFRQSLPVLITSLVNKSGSIGLSLLPILLVQGNYSTQASSLAMSAVKGSMILATFLSGFCSDSFGLRISVLASFLFAAIGLAFLPLSLGYTVLLFSGVIAQTGITSINGLMRLILTQSVKRENQKEALGWMRLVNNMGQILSYGLASLAAGFGAKLLIWFDALTSLLAFFTGWKILPQAEHFKKKKLDLSRNASHPSSWWPMVGCALIIAGWNFMYEFFMSGIAGKLKVVHPESGLRTFSLLMVVNTVVCAGLAVYASRFLKRVGPSLSAGILFTAGGLFLSMNYLNNTLLLFIGVLFVTLGEVAYGALAQFLLIRSIRPGRFENTVYSFALLFGNLVRMLAAAFVFPLYIHANQFGLANVLTVAITILSFSVLVIGKRALHRLAEN